MLSTILSLLVATLPSLADMKALPESMHGEKMAVEYQVLNSGKHILTDQENSNGNMPLVTTGRKLLPISLK